MNSIRRFLILVSLALITLVVFVAALQGYRFGLQNTEQLLDEQLIEKSDLLLLNAKSRTTVRPSLGNELLYQIYQSDNRLLQRTANAPELPLTDLVTGFDSVNYQGLRWRLYSKTRPDGLRVIVGEPINNRFKIAENIVLSIVTPVLLSLPLLALLIWLIVTQGLQPLARLTQEVKRRKPNDLTHIQHDGRLPLELQPLSLAMNGLLDRLSESLQREKRFSADAAHELRTPLSALKVNLYNLQSHLPANNPDASAMHQAVERMSHLIEQLLLLHRMSLEQARDSFEQVDVYELAQRVIGDHYQRIRQKNQEISLLGQSAIMIGNRFALESLLKNLLDNAHKYTPNNGEIHLQVTQTPKTLLLSVEDNGMGIDTTVMPRIFERFYRVDGDQHSSQIPGCGLGLSIVKHIVDLHGGEIRVEPSSFTTGLLIRIEFPVGTELPSPASAKNHD